MPQAQCSDSASEDCSFNSFQSLARKGGDPSYPTWQTSALPDRQVDRQPRPAPARRTRHCRRGTSPTPPHLHVPDQPLRNALLRRGRPKSVSSQALELQECEIGITPFDRPRDS